jgi:hypothetical protein
LKKGDPISNYEFFRKEESNTKSSEGKQKIFTAVEFTPDGTEILVA